jgi:hypothetical protein
VGRKPGGDMVLACGLMDNILVKLSLRRTEGTGSFSHNGKDRANLKLNINKSFKPMKK